MKLYTYQQMEAAFNAGKQKGAGELTGTYSMYPGFTEYMSKQEPEIDTTEQAVEAAKILADIGHEDTFGNVVYNKTKGHALSVNAIVSAVVQATHSVEGATGVTYEEIMRPSPPRRHSDAVAIPRQICYYLSYMHTPLTYAEIGKKFNGRKHDTILKGAKNVHHWIECGDEAVWILVKTYDILKDNGYYTGKLLSKLNSFKPIGS